MWRHFQETKKQAALLSISEKQGISFQRRLRNSNGDRIKTVIPNLAIKNRIIAYGPNAEISIIQTPKYRAMRLANGNAIAAHTAIIAIIIIFAPVLNQGFSAVRVANMLILRDPFGLSGRFR